MLIHDEKTSYPGQTEMLAHNPPTNNDDGLLSLWDGIIWLEGYLLY